MSIVLPGSPHPRILSVNGVLFTTHGDMGILKTHLFSAWPAEQLAQVVVANPTADWTMCQRYWQIIWRDALHGAATGRVLTAPGTPQPASPARPARAASGIGGMRQRLVQALTPLKLAASDYLMSRATLRDNGPLTEWLRAFAPEAIFTFGGNATILKYAVELSDLCQIPIVPYMTDDWIWYLYSGFPTDLAMRRTLQYWFRACLDRAPITLTIGEKMAEVYAERYGVYCEPCMDSIDVRRYALDAPAAATMSPDGVMRFRYIGVLEPGRWRPLRILGETLRDLQHQGVPVALEIYTLPRDAARYADLLNLSPTIGIVGSVPYEEVPGLQQTADVLVHVESRLHGRDQARTWLSVSTKIPQYLAAGRPILAMGPGDLASMEYLRHSGAAEVLDTDDPAVITATVRRLATDAALRQRLSAQGRATCTANHLLPGLRQRFLGAVRRAMQGTPCGVGAEASR